MAQLYCFVALAIILTLTVKMGFAVKPRPETPESAITSLVHTTLKRIKKTDGDAIVVMPNPFDSGRTKKPEEKVRL